MECNCTILSRQSFFSYRSTTKNFQYQWNFFSIFLKNCMKNMSIPGFRKISNLHRGNFKNSSISIAATRNFQQIVQSNYCLSCFCQTSYFLIFKNSSHFPLLHAECKGIRSFVRNIKCSTIICLQLDLLATWKLIEIGKPLENPIDHSSFISSISSQKSTPCWFLATTRKIVQGWSKSIL